MTFRVRLGPLLDVLVITSVSDVAALDAQPAATRDFARSRAWPARLVGRRFARTLAVRGALYPALRPREDQNRARRSERLRDRLDGADDAAAIRALTRYIRGEPVDVGIQVRRALAAAMEGAPDRIGAADVRAARRVNRAARLDPVRFVLARISGRLQDANARVDAATGGDPWLAHAIVVGAANVVAAAEAMRARVARGDAAVGAETAVRDALSAPTVLRTLSAGATISGRSLGPRTFVVLRPKPRGDAWRSAVFASDRWSACPAENLIVRWLTEAWRGATSARGAGDPSQALPPSDDPRSRPVPDRDRTAP